MYNYLTRRCRVYLPKAKHVSRIYCVKKLKVSIKFIQDLLSEKKKVIRRDQLLTREIGRYPEFTPKALVEGGFIRQDIINSYFPAQPANVDKAWCWNLF